MSCRRRTVTSRRESVGCDARLEPSWPEARANLSAALEQLGRHGDAAEQYREALRLDPSAARIRERLQAPERLAER